MSKFNLQRLREIERLLEQFQDNYDPLDDKENYELMRDAVASLAAFASTNSDLLMLVKVLARALKVAKPDSTKPDDAIGYLQRSGLISASDCLRAVNHE